MSQAFKTLPVGAFFVFTDGLEFSRGKTFKKVSARKYQQACTGRWISDPSIIYQVGTISVQVTEVAEPESLRFDRTKHYNGGPRYVVHFLNLLTRAEVDSRLPEVVGTKHRIACNRAHRIGGRQYRGKEYGGGIVFDSYSIDETAAHISRVTGRNFYATT